MNYLSPLYPRVLRNPHDEDRFSGSSPESVQVQMFIESLKDSREVTADNIAEHVLVSFKICVAQELDLNQYRGKLEALNEELDRIDRLDHDDFPYDTGFYLSFTDRLVQHPYQGEHYLSGVSREACNKHFIDAVRSSLSNKKLKSNLEFFATLPKLWKEAEDHGEAVRAAKQREDGDEAAEHSRRYLQTSLSGNGSGSAPAGRREKVLKFWNEMSNRSSQSQGLTILEYPVNEEEEKRNLQRWFSRPR